MKEKYIKEKDEKNTINIWKDHISSWVVKYLDIV